MVHAVSELHLLATKRLTVIAEIVVEHLEDGKRVPGVWRLLFQNDVQIDTEQRPERLAMINHRIRKPRERLLTHCTICFLKCLETVTGTQN